MLHVIPDWRLVYLAYKDRDGLTEEDLAVPDPEAQLVAALHVVPDWTVPYLAYMNWGELPEDEVLARQIIR